MSNVSSLNNRLNGYCNAFGNMEWNSERGKLTKTPKTPKAFFFHAFCFSLSLRCTYVHLKCVQRKLVLLNLLLHWLFMVPAVLLPSFFFLFFSFSVRADFGAYEFINICFVSDKMILCAALYGVFFYLFAPLVCFFVGFYICLYPYRHISKMRESRSPLCVLKAYEKSPVSMINWLAFQRIIASVTVHNMKARHAAIHSHFARTHAH